MSGEIIIIVEELCKVIPGLEREGVFSEGDSQDDGHVPLLVDGREFLLGDWGEAVGVLGD